MSSCFDALVYNSCLLNAVHCFISCSLFAQCLLISFYINIFIVIYANAFCFLSLSLGYWHIVCLFHLLHHVQCIQSFLSYFMPTLFLFMKGQCASVEITLKSNHYYYYSCCYTVADNSVAKNVGCTMIIIINICWLKHSFFILFNIYVNLWTSSSIYI